MKCNTWLLYIDSMKSTHILHGKKPFWYWNKAVLFYLLVQSFKCECNPELGTRLASDFSLYVIDNSLIGNKHKLLISGKRGEFIAAKIFKINVIHKIDYCYIAMKIRLSFTIMYNRTHKSDKTGEEYTQLLLIVQQDLSIVMSEL